MIDIFNRPQGATHATVVRLIPGDQPAEDIDAALNVITKWRGPINGPLTVFELVDLRSVFEFAVAHGISLELALPAHQPEVRNGVVS